MLRLKNITKSYDSKKIFDGFSCDFGENKITAIMGVSGVGKTTLFKIIQGTTKFSGEVLKDGDISCVFQTPRLIPNLTVYENLKFVMAGKTEGKDFYPMAKEILTRANIFDLIDAYPNEISGGEAQRVAFCRAFLYPSKIMLLDEPFSSLDLWSKGRLIDLFSDLLKENPKTCLFISHDIDEVLTLADDILGLKNDGQVLIKNELRNGETGDREKMRQKLISALQINVDKRE